MRKRKKERGGEGGFVDPGRQHLLRGARQHRHRRETILRALLHAQHRIHQAAFQGANADATDDAGPLGAVDRLTQAGAEHALLHPEVKLVLVIEATAAAVGLLLEGLEALLQEGAGGAHVGHPAAVAEAAKAAELPCGVDTAGGQGPGSLVRGQGGRR